MSSKKLSIIITTLLTLLPLVLYIIFKTKCFGVGCNPEVRDGLIVPLFWFGVPASVISAFFLFFPQVIFTSFLKRVVSWYLPILYFLTATTPLYSSHIMSGDRSVVVLYGMVLLGLIAVVYAFVMRKKLKV